MFPAKIKMAIVAAVGRPPCFFNFPAFGRKPLQNQFLMLPPPEVRRWLFGIARRRNSVRRFRARARSAPDCKAGTVRANHQVSARARRTKPDVPRSHFL